VWAGSVPGHAQRTEFATSHYKLRDRASVRLIACRSILCRRVYTPSHSLSITPLGGDRGTDHELGIHDSPRTQRESFKASERLFHPFPHCACLLGRSRSTDCLRLAGPPSAQLQGNFADFRNSGNQEYWLSSHVQEHCSRHVSARARYLASCPWASALLASYTSRRTAHHNTHVLSGKARPCRCHTETVTVTVTAAVSPWPAAAAPGTARQAHRCCYVLCYL
jgi:hypothetical protein